MGRKRSVNRKKRSVKRKVQRKSRKRSGLKFGDLNDLVNYYFPGEDPTLLELKNRGNREGSIFKLGEEIHVIITLQPGVIITTVYNTKNGCYKGATIDPKEFLSTLDYIEKVNKCEKK